MAKIAQKIYVDNFEVLETIINAFTLVEDADIDFSINRTEFENFCDEHEMREWSNETYSHDTECMTEDIGSTPWSEVYASPAVVNNFLKAYIQNLYDMEAMDIESTLRLITNSYKKAI